MLCCVFLSQPRGTATSHHMISHLIAHHHIPPSHHITSHRVSSHPTVTSHHISSHIITSHRDITSHLIPSHRHITSHLIAHHHIPPSHHCRDTTALPSHHLTPHRITTTHLLSRDILGSDEAEGRPRSAHLSDLNRHSMTRSDTVQRRRGELVRVKEQRCWLFVHLPPLLRHLFFRL